MWADLPFESVDLITLLEAASRAVNLIQQLYPDVGNYPQIRVDMVMTICRVVTNYLKAINQSVSYSRGTLMHSEGTVSMLYF